MNFLKICKHKNTQDNVKFRVVMYTENVERDYHLTTIDQAEAKEYLERVKAACKSKAFQEKQKVRLKNGFLYYETGGNNEDGNKNTKVSANNEDGNKYKLINNYEDQIKYKLMNNSKRGDQKPQTLSKEDCLIALAYAAENDDVEEVVELVKDAGPEILSTQMSFASLGTILHVCAEWSSLKTLEKVVKDYPTSLDVLIRDKYGDTALHNIPNMSVQKSDEDCKRAARCLLGLAGVLGNELLAVQNDYGEMTALCKALAYEERVASKALLDAAKEHVECSIRASQQWRLPVILRNMLILDAANIKHHEENSATNEAEQNWLALKAHGEYIDGAYQGNEDLQYPDEPPASCTALHLAILAGYNDVVTQILAYPGAKEAGLPSCQDQIGNTPLHLAAMLGNQDICSVLLKNIGVAVNKDGSGGVKSENNDGETPLHVAATSGHAEVCEKLLQYGASLSSKDKRGRYALTNAYQKGKQSTTTSAETWEAVKKLLDACLPPKKGKKSTTTSAETEPSALMNAKPAGSSNSVINMKFELGLTPLHVAVAISSESHIKALIKAEAFVNSTNDDDCTPLHDAAQHCKRGTLVKLLLGDISGAKFSNSEKSQSREEQIQIWINMQDTSGKTALHNAVKPLSHSYSNMSDRDEGRCRWCQKDSVEGVGNMPDSDEGSNNEITCEESSNRHEMSTQSAESIAINEACELVKLLLEKGACVDVQDCTGETPLHEAARTHHMLVDALLSATSTNFKRDATDNRGVWISMCDFSGETALHEAARVGNVECVKYLLKDVTESRRDDLLRVRDMENMTALDWAASLEREKSIVEAKEQKRKLEAEIGIPTCSEYPAMDWPALREESIIDVMMDHCKTSNMTKEFLMWHLRDHVHRDVHEAYCTGYEVEREALSETLLETAVAEQDVDIARQLINQGADVTHLDDDARRWLAQQLGKMSSDRPTSEDSLGRKGLVKAVATLLLNPYTQTPLTIGIFGSWGMGKSSFMLQVEEAMLYMAVKETFRKETCTVKFSKFGRVLRYMVARTFKHRIEKLNKYKGPTQQETLGGKRFPTHKETTPKRDIENQNPSKDENDIIDEFPMELQSNDPYLFRNLALTDRSKLVQTHASAAVYHRKVGVSSQTLQAKHQLAYRPAMLTLHYNAWEHDNKIEACAGLAVEICHQLETFMTPHQWLKMCWKYSWKRQPTNIFVHFLIPAFIAIITIWATIMFWKFISISTKLKFLSLPLGIVGVMWTIFKACLKIIQPVTQTMVNLVKTIDHQSMLGYQHQVIHDINFLKDQLCEDAHFGWMILSFVCQLFISKRYFMEGTWIWKQHPCLNNFRIVVFIDDLDRCDEKTILELLRVINLILGSCGINVVIGVDKKMLQRAITREFLKDTGDKVLDLDVDYKIYSKEIALGKMDFTNMERSIEEIDSQNAKTSKNNSNNEKHSYVLELADNYLQKIIQLPIQMLDPSKESIEHFVQGQVGQRFIKNHEVEDQEKKIQEGKQKENNETKKDLDEIEGENVSDLQSKEIAKKHVKEEHAMKNKGSRLTQDATTDGEGKPIEFQLLLANYTPMEKDILKRLCQSTTTIEGRLPREWKRFFNYHQLAWNVLSQDSNMKSIQDYKGWQGKLILWIFICWNWRPQMDLIFLKWHDLISKSSNSQSQDLLSKSTGATKYDHLNLSNIINTYMESMGRSIKENTNQNIEKQGSEMVQTHWKDLCETIKREYDIPMKFIRKFQQFRFYCVFNHLDTGI